MSQSWGGTFHSIILADNSAVATADIAEMVKMMKAKTGTTGVEVDGTTDTQINFTAAASAQANAVPQGVLQRWAESRGDFWKKRIDSVRGTGVRPSL